MTDPVIWAASECMGQASSTYAYFESTWAAQVQCPITLAPCTLESVSIWLNISGLKLVNGGLLLSPSGAHGGTDTALVETGRATCRLYCTPIACILKHEYPLNLQQELSHSIKGY